MSGVTGLADVFARPVMLRTARLSLRQITETDGPGLFDIFGDALVTEHYAWDTFTDLGQAEALVAEVLRFGFDQMALNRVEATVLTGNTASTALLHRMGFTREGVLRERTLTRGAFRDVWMFGLTRAEWTRGR